MNLLFLIVLVLHCIDCASRVLCVVSRSDHLVVCCALYLFKRCTSSASSFKKRWFIFKNQVISLVDF